MMKRGSLTIFSEQQVKQADEADAEVLRSSRIIYNLRQLVHACESREDIRGCSP